MFGKEVGWPQCLFFFFFFFLSYSAAAAKYKKKNLIPSPPQPNTFLGKFFQFFFFEKFLYIYTFVLTHAESFDNLPRPFTFFFEELRNVLSHK